MGRFNDQSINVLFIDEGGNERDCPFESAFNGTDGLNEGLFGATDGDSGEYFDVGVFFSEKLNISLVVVSV